MKPITLFGILLLSAFTAMTSLAVEPSEILDDPVLEERARTISKNLRCVVCQNETIDDSNATIAQDMRRLVRQRLLDGDSDQDVLDYMVDRYGDFVLLRPQFKTQTLLLWLGPIILLLIGGGVVARYVRQSSPTVGAQLTDSELAEVKKLLSETDRETDT